MTRRRRWVRPVVITLAFAVVLGAATWVAPSLKSPEQVAADAAAPPPSLITVAAQRKTLVEKVLLRGKVEAGASIGVSAPVTGPNAVVTNVFVSAGDVLVEGKVVVEVSGEPVFPLVLPFPLYRDISDGMTGPDVHEVQKALRRMGYRVPGSGAFDAATQAALGRMYLARGYRLTQRSAPPAATTTPAAGDPQEEVHPPVAVALSKAHVIRIDRPTRVISKVGVAIGDVLGQTAAPGAGESGGNGQSQALFELDAGPATVTAVVGQDQIGALRPGAAAEVIDDVGGTRSTAAVETVGTTPRQGSDGAPGYDVRLVFRGPALAPTPNHTVRVTVGDTTGAAPVLAVPITAVYSRMDGSTFVTVEDRGATTDHDVRVGGTADGWVAIVDPPTALTEGTPVVVGRAIG
ncbi:peptidoglycan-binding domain-containing protein [Actinokineospora spheciospongiae]|uniref:peptidoglycan-binding domain-containing protein n=1 Tax=Actinokineospora spheciospongiae TaxID=909613 RepID=UPI0004BC3061|nr:peptidoglycan-binding domain-containing protein [Actinokineospora spheciospongiae]